LGGIGLYLALPGKRPSASWIGLLLLAASAGVLAYLLHAAVSPLTAGGQEFWFVALALVGLFGAVNMLISPQPVYSALFFILVIIATTGLVLLAEAEFLAVALLIIYAGAILVTYLFVIMLAKQSGGPAPYDRRARTPLIGCVVGFVLLGLVSRALVELGQVGIGDVPAGSHRGAAQEIGGLILTDYIIAVQIAGVILLAAMVGAIAVARRQPSPEEEVEL
jgi:NADH-quinone oxidoreductase subunit J